MLKSQILVYLAIWLLDSVILLSGILDETVAHNHKLIRAKSPHTPQSICVKLIRIV